jgi:mannose-6-phosphate isomerase
MRPLAPLRLEPILLEKVWGGRRLSRWGKALPPGLLIGESWEVADLDETDPAGAGGGARSSIVAEGPLAGRSIREVMRLWGEDLMGAERASLAPGSGGRSQDSQGAGLPLLVKLLDAREHLSVQVHPSATYAASHPGASLKSECWYVLEAEPRAVIYKGLKSGIAPEELRARIAAGAIVESLVAEPARPGDLHHLPSGTIHALGAGVLVAEVQTPSDTTFRVYDWSAEYGRSGRELHVEQALACVDFGPAPDAVRLTRDAEAGRLLRTEHFTIDEAIVAPGDELIVGADGALGIVICIDGEGVIASGRLVFNEVPLARGDVLLLPAALGTDALARASAEGLRLLRAGL